MNKTELVEHIAKHADISKAAATRALDSTITAIRTTLKKGGTVSLVGFGSFAVTKRPARKGHFQVPFCRRSLSTLRGQP